MKVYMIECNGKLVFNTGEYKKTDIKPQHEWYKNRFPKGNVRLVTLDFDPKQTDAMVIKKKAG